MLRLGSSLQGRPIFLQNIFYELLVVNILKLNIRKNKSQKEIVNCKIKMLWFKKIAKNVERLPIGTQDHSTLQKLARPLLVPSQLKKDDIYGTIHFKCALAVSKQNLQEILPMTQHCSLSECRCFYPNEQNMSEVSPSVRESLRNCKIHRSTFC